MAKGNLHRISTVGSRGSKPLVETGLVLRVRDLRGVHGFFGSHQITAADGTVIRFRCLFKKTNPMDICGASYLIHSKIFEDFLRERVLYFGFPVLCM